MPSGKRFIAALQWGIVALGIYFAVYGLLAIYLRMNFYRHPNSPGGEAIMPGETFLNALFPGGLWAIAGILIFAVTYTFIRRRKRAERSPREVHPIFYQP